MGKINKTEKELMVTLSNEELFALPINDHQTLGDCISFAVIRKLKTTKFADAKTEKYKFDPKATLQIAFSQLP